MDKRNLGRSGLQVSAVGLGCNAFGGRLDVGASRKVIHAALDLGITLFDTSDLYGDDYGVPSGSELCLGEVLADRRKDVILATKFGNERHSYGAGVKGGASRYVVMRAVEESLRRLRTDWIDLYQIHKFDPRTPLEETLRALDDLVRQGKVRYIGCSNFSAWQTVEAQWTARHLNLHGFVTCQNEYSVLVRDVERELLPAMRAHGLGMLPYFPLAAGLLTGKYRRNVRPSDEMRLAHNKRWADRFMIDANWTKLERLEEFCAERGHNILELAMSWLIAQPIVSSIIAGATKPEQVRVNVESTKWKLTAEEMAEIDRLTQT